MALPIWPSGNSRLKPEHLPLIREIFPDLEELIELYATTALRRSEVHQEVRSASCGVTEVQGFGLSGGIRPSRCGFAVELACHGAGITGSKSDDRPEPCGMASATGCGQGFF